MATNTSANVKEIQVVAFQLGNQEYGVDILSVQEIIKTMNITRVPRTPNHFEGVINLRGVVIPVFNLHKRFGITPLGNENEARIIVFRFDDIKAGIIVDGVSEVLRISTSEIEDASKIYNYLDGEYIRGVGKVNGRLLIILNLERLLGIDSFEMEGI